MCVKAGRRLGRCGNIFCGGAFLVRPLAGDIGRALGDNVAWAWPDRGNGAETLSVAEAVERHLFTGILLFGNAAKQLFSGRAPEVIGSARVLQAPGLEELEVRGTAKQELWRLLSGGIHERRS